MKLRWCHTGVIIGIRTKGIVEGSAATIIKAMAGSLITTHGARSSATISIELLSSSTRCLAHHAIAVVTTTSGVVVAPLKPLWLMLSCLYTV